MAAGDSKIFNEYVLKERRGDYAVTDVWRLAFISNTFASISDDLGNPNLASVTVTSGGNVASSYVLASVAYTRATTVIKFDATVLPAGILLPFGGSSSPTGWLLCDGQAVSRTTYSDLFDIIGTTFGIGDGSSTFNVPDMRGNFPLGKDNMGGSSRNRVTNTNADTFGAEEG